MWYHSLLSVVLMIPLVVASGEVSTLWTKGLSLKGHFWIHLMSLGLEGYVVTLLNCWMIKYTSPFATNIFYIAKHHLHMVILAVYWNNALSAQAALGIAFTIFGSLLYIL